MHRLSLVALLALACDAPPERYREQWCARFCADAPPDRAASCRRECAPDAGPVDAGTPGDAGSASDAGSGGGPGDGGADAGPVDAGGSNPATIVLSLVGADGGVLRLSAARCEQVEVEARHVDGSLALEPTSVTLSGQTSVLFVAGCVSPGPTTVTAVGGHVSLWVQSSDPAAVFVTMMPPIGAAANATLQFKVRLNASRLSPGTLCRGYQVRFAPLGAGTPPLATTALGIELASDAPLFVDATCTTPYNVPPRVGPGTLSETVYLNATQARLWSSILPDLFEPVEVTATGPPTSASTCDGGIDCASRSCSAGVCSCSERGARCDPGACCSGGCDGGICQ